MHIIFYLIAGFAAIPQTLAGLITVESINTIPDGWSYSAAARDGDIVTVSIALKQRGIKALKMRLDLTSDPTHAEYGRHMSQNDVFEATTADQSSVNTVMEWLNGSGVEDVNVDITNAMIEVTARAELMRKVLNTEELGYYTFKNRRDGDTPSTHLAPVLRARSYAVPEDIRDHISFVHPLNNFMPPVRQHKIQQDTATTMERRGETDFGACINATVPSCIRQMYNLTYMPDLETASQARLGIAGFLEQFINFGDVDEWRKEYIPDIPESYNFTVQLVNNGTNDQTLWRAGIEAALDVEYAMALAYPVPVTYYSTGGRGAKLGGKGEEIKSDNEPYLEFLQNMLNLTDDEIPHVISVSYADDEQSVPRPYAERVCDLFAALTARGTTIMVATGDGGARGIGIMQCMTNDGTDLPHVLSTFPASCPYVTSVGATTGAYPPVWGAPFSTGGFSDYFPRPAFQDSEVAGYLADEEDGAREGMFNPSGRAIPDLSAVGNGFKVRYGGGPSTVLGTSASTPVVASLISLAVDRRIREGKTGPLGWLNPALYADGVRETLYDVRDGTSQGCRLNETQIAGWGAREGWDAITGLGAVGDFWEFLEALTELPGGVNTDMTCEDSGECN